MTFDKTLPLPAEKLVPHRPPFLFVDRLLEFTGDMGVVETVIAPDNLFLNDNGELLEVVMIEIIAQAAATVKGYSDILTGENVKNGFLVDSRKFIFSGKCRVGEKLISRIEVEKRFSGFSMLKGSLERAGEKIGSGSLKLFVPEEADKE